MIALMFYGLFHLQCSHKLMKTKALKDVFMKMLLNNDIRVLMECKSSCGVYYVHFLRK